VLLKTLPLATDGQSRWNEDGTPEPAQPARRYPTVVQEPQAGSTDEPALNVFFRWPTNEIWFQTHSKFSSKLWSAICMGVFW